MRELLHHGEWRLFGAMLLTFLLVYNCTAIIAERPYLIYEHPSASPIDLVGGRPSSGLSYTEAVLSCASRLPETNSTAQAQLNDTYSKLPVSFEANYGQADARVKFISRGNRYN